MAREEERTAEGEGREGRNGRKERDRGEQNGGRGGERGDAAPEDSESEEGAQGTRSQSGGVENTGEGRETWIVSLRLHSRAASPRPQELSGSARPATPSRASFHPQRQGLQLGRGRGGLLPAAQRLTDLGLACRERNTLREDGSSESNCWGKKQKLLRLSWRPQTLHGAEAPDGAGAQWLLVEIMHRDASEGGREEH